MSATTPGPTPTGAQVSGPETLRRSVPVALLKEDGQPSSSAFIASSHDGMMSTLRERVAAEDAADRWKGKSPLAGVWPVAVDGGEANGAKVYDDGDEPCACGGSADGCGGPYPTDHASVDLRPFGRSRRERIAKQLRDAAVNDGALLKASTDS